MQKFRVTCFDKSNVPFSLTVTAENENAARIKAAQYVPVDCIGSVVAV